MKALSLTRYIPAQKFIFASTLKETLKSLLKNCESLAGSESIKIVDYGERVYPLTYQIVFTVSRGRDNHRHNVIQFLTEDIIVHLLICQLFLKSDLTVMT